MQAVQSFHWLDFSLLLDHWEWLSQLLSLTACPVPKVCIKRLQVSLLPSLGMGSLAFVDILNIFGNKADVQSKICEVLENSTDMLDNLSVSQEQLGLSTKCHKTRTKVITLAIQKGHRRYSKSLKTQSKIKHLSGMKDWKMCMNEGVMTGFRLFYFSMNGWKSGRNILRQLQGNANPKKMHIAFDTLEKTDLTYY